MIIETFEQGSPEWFDARVGIPTASEFKKIVTSTGAKSKSADKYRYQLACERILGKCTETIETAAMRRGIEMEPEAREYLEFTMGVVIPQVGICYYDEHKAYSCSPDGLGDAIGYEIKCPNMETHAEWLSVGTLPTKHVQQVQGCMAVTGFEEWIFCSYYPGLPDLTLTIKRDEAFITKLQVALAEFNEKLDETTEKLRAK